MLRNKNHKIGCIFRYFHKVSTRFCDQSYVHGATDIPLLNHTVADRFRIALEKEPDKPMVIFKQCGIQKTYQQVFDDARQFAASLIHLKLKKGDRIGIWGPNYYEWVVTKYAAALSGLILVNINPAYKADELKFALQKVGISAIISPMEYKTSNYYRTLTEVIPKMLQSQAGNGNVKSNNLPELKHVILFKTDKWFRGAWNFNELISSPGSSDFKLLDEYESKIRVDDPFNIQFTSGTTGQPKAATLSHHNVVNNAYFIGLRAGFDKNQEKLVIPVPLSHAFGFVIGLLNAVCHNQTSIFPSPTFNAKSVLKAINDEKPTLLYGTPTMFIDILNEPSLATTDISSIHGGMTGGI
uniref:Medium-chain acyl-CoA ligase ACSF2, mitochondrial n=1 Tax=Panagrolaimus davidi TaxID=227884 RepID=A0A914R4M0_9BILA